MADGNIAGRVRPDRQADPHQGAGHAVQHVGFGIDRHQPLGARGVDPAVQRLLRHDRLIQAAVDRRLLLRHRRRGRRAVGRGGRRCRDRNGGGRRAQAVEQRLEAMMLQESLQRLLGNTLQRQIVEWLGQVHRIVQRHQLARQPRHVGMGDQIFLHLRLLHGRRRLQRRLQAAIFGDELRRRLGADPRHARHIVDAVAHQRQHVAQPIGLHAELAHHIVRPAPLILHRVVHVDAGLDQLHQILVGTDDGDMPSRRDRRLGVAGDDVVGFKALLLDAGQGEGARRIADHRKLRDQILGRGRAVRLILVVHVVAEGVRPLVQDHRQMRRPLGLTQFFGQLPQHRRIAIDRANGLAMPVGERGKLVIGAENIARAVDEIEMILGHGERDSLYPRAPPARYRVS